MFPHNSLPFIQYSTNTDFEIKDFSSSEEKDADKVDTFLKLIKSEVVDAVEFEIEGYKQVINIASSFTSLNFRILEKNLI